MEAWEFGWEIRFSPNLYFAVRSPECRRQGDSSKAAGSEGQKAQEQDSSSWLSGPRATLGLRQRERVTQ